jgi:hypothetical protein
MEPNRIGQFCASAPATAVVRAKVRVGPPNEVAVERLYGTPAPTALIPARFARLADDETLLVSLAHDGQVVGTAWPVFREQVSLEFGIPDLKEEEAASLLLSPKCVEGLRALRDHGVRPAAAHMTTGGYSRCDVARGPVDASTFLMVLVVLAALRRLLGTVVTRRPTTIGT